MQKELTYIDRRRPSLRTRAVMVLLLAALLLVPTDNFRLNPFQKVASEHLFSIVQWEITNFPKKWVHALWQLIPGNKPSRDERLLLVDEYLQLSRKVQKEEARIEGVLIRRGAPHGSDIAAKEVEPNKDYLEELSAQRRRLRNKAEEAVEAELSSVLAELGFESRIGLIFPPVDLKFEEPPTLLVISPRDELKVVASVLLDSDLNGIERDAIEQQILREQDVSALVDDLAGIATYPTIVSDLYTTRTIMRTVAHEWLHTYFFFRPLGQNLHKNDAMFTLNETAADVAGRVLGDMVFERMGGDLSVSASRYASEEDRFPEFTKVMRETRHQVEELLKEGKVHEAEEYMRKQQWFLRLRGFGLRKLNQAYLAFRGRYAESPASVNPIGDQLSELSDLLPSVAEFIREVSQVSSIAEFKQLLERVRSEAVVTS